MHSKKRVESTLCIVKGVKNELIAAVESSTQRRRSYADNARMVAGTKDTTPGETKKSSITQRAQPAAEALQIALADY